MGKQQDHVAEAIALMDKSAERTRPNAQTQAWATIRAHIEGLEALLGGVETQRDENWKAYEAAEARVLELEADAGRWRAMREHMVAVDWQPQMGGGPVVMFECLAKRVSAGPEGADAIADSAVEFAAIDTAMQASREGR